MTIKQSIAAIAFFFLATTAQLNAQNVDIQLRNTVNTLEVWLTPKANYSGIVSALTFTISWDIAYNVDLVPSGSETVHIPNIPLQAAGVNQASMTNGSRQYRTYSSNGGASSISLTNNAPIKIMSVVVPRTSSIPTGMFSLSNDAFTAANNMNYYFELGGNDITGSTTTLATNVPIPVELISFTGIEKDNAAHLTWHTANEQQFSHFDIERSYDVKNWKNIGVQKSNWATQNGKNRVGWYFLTDAAAFAQTTTAFYRLKMVDLDGSFKFSNVVAIESPKATTTTVKLYPNPTKGDLYLNLNVSAETQRTFDIFDLAGRLQQRISMPLKKGDNLLKLDVAVLPEGVYFLHILEQNRRLEVVKFSKL